MFALALAIVVATSDNDGAPPPSAPTGQAIAAVDPQPEGTSTPTPSPTTVRRQITIKVEPTSTPRVIKRPKQSPTPKPSPTLEPTATSSPAPNLVANGGFEAEGGGWYFEQGAQRAGGIAHEGERALLIDSAGGYADQRVPVEPGATYELTVWVRVATGGGGEIGLRFEDARFNSIPVAPIQTAISGSEWTRVTIPLTSPEGAERVVLSFWNPGGAQIAVDDVTLRRTDRS
jgi:hypothetical protein